MNNENALNEPFDKPREFVNRTKWEKEEKGEKKSFLQRKQEEKEARRALRDFRRDYLWEHMDDREENDWKTGCPSRRQEMAL